MTYEKPDVPMEHQCEKCGQTATWVAYMYHVPTKSACYRYFCPNCAMAVCIYQKLQGNTAVTLEEVGQ